MKEKKKTKGLGNLSIFGFNLSDLIENLSGHTLEEIAQNPELTKEIREKLEKINPETKSFQKKFGNVSVNYKVTSRSLSNLGKDNLPNKENKGKNPIHVIKPKKKERTLTLKITEEQLSQDLKTKKKKDTDWEKEEKKIFEK